MLSKLLERKRYWLVALIIVAISFSGVVYAYVSNQIAAIALGQDSLTEGEPNKGGSPDDTTFNFSDGEDFYGKVRIGFPYGLLIADTLNNRVLLWETLEGTQITLGQEDSVSA